MSRVCTIEWAMQKYRQLWQAYYFWNILHFAILPDTSEENLHMNSTIVNIAQRK